MKRIIIALFCLMVVSSTCLACIADVGTANTNVYVRSIETGEIVGSLAKNDRVAVVGKIGGGWSKIKVGDKEYKVWHEYLNIEEGAEVKGVISKVRKSKSAEKAQKSQVKIKSKKKFKKGSEWDDLGAALFF